MMAEMKKGILAAALAAGLMTLSGAAALAAPAINHPGLGGSAPLVEQAQLYFGVPGVGIGVGGGPYYGGGYRRRYYGGGPYYGRRYYGRRGGCRIRYTPYGPRRICW